MNIKHEIRVEFFFFDGRMGNKVLHKIKFSKIIDKEIRTAELLCR